MQKKPLKPPMGMSRRVSDESSKVSTVPTPPIFYNGIDTSSFKLDSGKVHRGTICAAFPNGCIGLLLKDDEQERISRELTCVYKDDKSIANYKLPDVKLKEGMMVVARLNGNDFVRGWLREDVERNQPSVNLFLVDTMTAMDDVRRENLYLITEAYCKQPYLAGIVNLQGLEFVEFMRTNEVLQKELAFAHKLFEEEVSEHLKKKVLVSCVKSQLKEKFCKADMKLCNEKLSLNEIVRNKIIAGANGTFPNKPGEKARGFICHADKNGTVYVHMEQSLVEFVCEYLDEFASARVAKGGSAKGKLNARGELYITKYDNGLCRAEIVDTMDNKTVLVRYVDYGNTEEVDKTKLIPASEIDPLLNKIPPLVYAVRLKWVDKIIDMDKFTEFFDTLYDIELRSEVTDGYKTVVVTKEDEPDAHKKVLNKLLILNKIASKKTDDKSIPKHKK